MRGVWFAVALVALSACTSAPPAIDLREPATGGTPTDRFVIRSLQLSIAQELAMACPNAVLSDAQFLSWQNAILNAYEAELALNPDQVPELFSAEFESLGGQAPELLAAYRQSRGLGAPPYGADEACRVLMQERQEGTFIGRILA